MAVVTENEVTEVLAKVIVPDQNNNVIALGLISGIVVKDGMVHITVEARGNTVNPIKEPTAVIVTDPGIILPMIANDSKKANENAISPPCVG